MIEEIVRVGLDIINLTHIILQIRFEKDQIQRLTLMDPINGFFYVSIIKNKTCAFKNFRNKRLQELCR